MLSLAHQRYRGTEKVPSKDHCSDRTSPRSRQRLEPRIQTFGSHAHYTTIPSPNSASRLTPNATSDRPNSKMTMATPSIALLSRATPLPHSILSLAPHDLVGLVRPGKSLSNDSDGAIMLRSVGSMPCLQNNRMIPPDSPGQLPRDREDQPKGQPQSTLNTRIRRPQSIVQIRDPHRPPRYLQSPSGRPSVALKPADSPHTEHDGVSREARLSGQTFRGVGGVQIHPMRSVPNFQSGPTFDSSQSSHSQPLPAKKQPSRSSAKPDGQHLRPSPLRAIHGNITQEGNNRIAPPPSSLARRSLQSLGNSKKPLSVCANPRTLRAPPSVSDISLVTATASGTRNYPTRSFQHSFDQRIADLEAVTVVQKRQISRHRPSKSLSGDISHSSPNVSQNTDGLEQQQRQTPTTISNLPNSSHERQKYHVHSKSATNADDLTSRKKNADDLISRKRTIPSVRTKKQEQARPLAPFSPEVEGLFRAVWEAGRSLDYATVMEVLAEGRIKKTQETVAGDMASALRAALEENKENREVSLCLEALNEEDVSLDSASPPPRPNLVPSQPPREVDVVSPLPYRSTYNLYPSKSPYPPSDLIELFNAAVQWVNAGGAIDLGFYLFMIEEQVVNDWKEAVDLEWDESTLDVVGWFYAKELERCGVRLEDYEHSFWMLQTELLRSYKEARGGCGVNADVKWGIELAWADIAEATGIHCTNERGV